MIKCNCFSNICFYKKTIDILDIFYYKSNGIGGFYEFAVENLTNMYSALNAEINLEYVMLNKNLFTDSIDENTFHNTINFINNIKNSIMYKIELREEFIREVNKLYYKFKLKKNIKNIVSNFVYYFKTNLDVVSVVSNCKTEEINIKKITGIYGRNILAVKKECFLNYATHYNFSVDNKFKIISFSKNSFYVLYILYCLKIVYETVKILEDFIYVEKFNRTTENNVSYCKKLKEKQEKILEIIESLKLCSDCRNFTNKVKNEILY